MVHAQQRRPAPSCAQRVQVDVAATNALAIVAIASSDAAIASIIAVAIAPSTIAAAATSTIAASDANVHVEWLLWTCARRKHLRSLCCGHVPSDDRPDRMHCVPCWKLLLATLDRCDAVQPRHVHVDDGAECVRAVRRRHVPIIAQPDGLHRLSCGLLL